MTAFVPHSRPWLTTYERYRIRPDIQLPAADSSLLEQFDQRLARFAERCAYWLGEQSLSYAELDQNSRLIARHLQAMGLVRGDAVGVMLPNLLQYPIIAVAVIRAGLVLVTINPSHTTAELAHQLVDAGIKVAFILDKFIGKFTQLDTTVRQQLAELIICHPHELTQGWLGRRLNRLVIHRPRIRYRYFYQLLTETATLPAYQRPNLCLNDIALIQYTGGTTDQTKGVMLSHGNLIANVLQIDGLVASAYPQSSYPSSAYLQGGYNDEPADVVLAALPLYHVFSFTLACLLLLYRGYTGLFVPNPSQPSEIIKAMKSHPPSFILGVNPLYSSLLQQPAFRQLDFSRLKATVGGGMAISPLLAESWHEVTGLPIIEGYGLSETAPVATFNPLTIAEFTHKVGIPAPATDIILLDEDDQPVAIGERGEIAIKGPQVMQGYHNQPQQTAAAFTQTGYLRSGDIGIMDEQGFIKIVDRKKDMMVVSGFNVYPAEIEAVMLEHPDVLECAAIGVPSPTRGEEPKIFVVKRRPALTAEQLLAFGKANLIGYKRPRHVAFVDFLPKSAVGKVLRKELRKREGLE